MQQPLKVLNSFSKKADMSLFDIITNKQTRCDQLGHIPMRGEEIDLQMDEVREVAICEVCEEYVSPIELEAWEKEMAQYPSMLSGEDNPLAHI